MADEDQNERTEETVELTDYYSNARQGWPVPLTSP